MNVAGVGTLSSLGTMAPQEEFYARHSKRKKPADGGFDLDTEVVFQQHGKSTKEQLQAVQHQGAALHDWMARHAVHQQDAMNVELALRRALLHAVLLLVHMLVPVKARLWPTAKLCANTLLIIWVDGVSKSALSSSPGHVRVIAD
jgi:hypothetical protein